MWVGVEEKINEPYNMAEGITRMKHRKREQKMNARLTIMEDKRTGSTCSIFQNKKEKIVSRYQYG